MWEDVSVCAQSLRYRLKIYAFYSDSNSIKKMSLNTRYTTCQLILLAILTLVLPSRQVIE